MSWGTNFENLIDQGENESEDQQIDILSFLSHRLITKNI